MIKIFDDDEWEPDEDFFVDLYELIDDIEVPANKVNPEELNILRMIGGDTATRVTIIDDDKPGELVFAEKRAIRHAANESNCRVVVKRVHGSDGTISC